MKSYTDPSHLGIGRTVLEDAVEYLNQTPDQDFPLAKETVEEETGVRILGYDETLEHQSYTVLEQNGELYLDRKQSFVNE